MTTVSGGFGGSSSTRAGTLATAVIASEDRLSDEHDATSRQAAPRAVDRNRVSATASAWHRFSRR
jgi:hypothetical protein